ncbi:MAG: hypothetical protein ACOYT4_01025 [Nanoarchaeota archaeon]
MDKRAEFNFEWIFAIFAGIAILFLAIYGVSKIGETQKYQTDTVAAKEFTILLDPLQTNFFEDSAYNKIIFKQETQAKFKCYSEDFGKNQVSIKTVSNIGKNAPESALISVKNKYIFSKDVEQGKSFNVISMPFEFPFKVTDIVLITAEEYCFLEPPFSIKDNLIGIKNIKFENCSEDFVKVCFDYEDDCDIIIDESSGFVEKNDQKLYYSGNLLYAAIVSDKEIYDCNVERLLYRTKMISDIYAQKADLATTKNCNTNIKADLEHFSNLLNEADPSSLYLLERLAKELDKRNNKEVCSLW